MFRGLLACDWICPKAGSDKFVTGELNTVRLNGLESSVRNWIFIRSRMDVFFRMANDSDRFAGARRLIYRDVFPNVKGAGAMKAAGLIHRSRPGSKRPDPIVPRCAAPATTLGRSSPLKMGSVLTTDQDSGNPLPYDWMPLTVHPPKIFPVTPLLRYFFPAPMGNW